jgi:hypothetical protein
MGPHGYVSGPLARHGHATLLAVTTAWTGLHGLTGLASSTALCLAGCVRAKVRWRDLGLRYEGSELLASLALDEVRAVRCPLMTRLQELSDLGIRSMRVRREGT